MKPNKISALLFILCLLVLFLFSVTAVYGDEQVKEENEENVITETDGGGGDITGREVAMIFGIGAAAFLAIFLIGMAL